MFFKIIIRTPKSLCKQEQEEEGNQGADGIKIGERFKYNEDKKMIGAGTVK